MKANDLIKVLFTMLAGIVVLLYIPGVMVGVSNWPALGAFALVLWVLLDFLMTFIYFPPRQFLTSIKKTKPESTLVSTQKAVQQPVQEPVQVLELSSPDNNPFIRQNSIGETITVGGKSSLLYRWQDYRFNLDVVPHTLLAASSGSGKSTALFNLLRRLNSQYNYPKVVLCDAGNFDFPEAIAYDTEDIIKTLEYLYLIMRGRQTAREHNATRLIWVVEEAEAFMAALDLLPKKRKDIIITMLANFGRLARKTRINAIFVNQKAGAGEFPTPIRDNFSGRFILRSPNNLSTTLGCGFDTSNLPVGVAYNTNADAFIKFDLVDKPGMNLLSMDDLKRLAMAYRRQYELKSPLEGIEDV